MKYLRLLNSNIQEEFHERLFEKIRLEPGGSSL